MNTYYLTICLDYPFNTKRPLEHFIDVINQFKSIVSQQVYRCSFSEELFSHEKDNISYSNYNRISCFLQLSSLINCDIRKQIDSISKLFFSNYNNVSCYVFYIDTDVDKIKYTLENLPAQPPLFNNRREATNYYKSLKQTVC